MAKKKTSNSHKKLNSGESSTTQRETGKKYYILFSNIEIVSLNVNIL